MFFMETDFGRWLLGELNRRDWSQNELGRRANLTSGTISNAINGLRKPAPETLQAIAHALRMPKEAVYREAGLLSSVPEHTERHEQLLHLFDQLNENDKTTILRMMEFLLTK